MASTMIDPTITVTRIEALMRTFDVELRATCSAGQWHATLCSSGGAEYTGIGRSLLDALEDLFDVVDLVVDGVPGEAA